MEAMRNGLGLGTIRVYRSNLLNTLKANRQKHLEEYTKANEGFQIATVKELKQILKEAQAGNIKSHYAFDKPVSHEEDYNTVIGMLEMSIETELHITRDEYCRYVEDKWGWKQTFALTNLKYMSGV